MIISIHANYQSTVISVEDVRTVGAIKKMIKMKNIIGHIS